MTSKTSTGIATDAQSERGVDVGVVRDDLRSDVEPRTDADERAEQDDVPISPYPRTAGVPGEHRVPRAS